MSRIYDELVRLSETPGHFILADAVGARGGDGDGSGATASNSLIADDTPADNTTIPQGQAGSVVTRPVSAAAKAAASPIEDEDDPHRLARINLEKYATHENGATLRRWRDEWYTWKPSRGCYRKITEGELRARITMSIKQEFDRLNIEAQETSTEVPRTKKVTSSLVTNVLNASASMVIVSSNTELMTWISKDGSKSRRNYVSMANGILDLDRALENRPEDDLGDVMIPHTPEWFSTVCLPYAFDPTATCQKWQAFLEKNLEMDPERIKILQEWAGYLLLPDTSEQKFLVLEGEGANGKSVYCAAIAAMIGQDNCSHVPLEIFGDRFSKTQTIGKLVNISADVGELDKVAEGYLKSFTSGDVMFFDRKNMDPINCTPTARLIMACNNRPRFSDRSSGIWRRMLLIPWMVQIATQDRVRNMDKPWWWEQSGELPGIFNWALQGLARLRKQHGFTSSSKSKDALEDYQIETNPARAFLTEHLAQLTPDDIAFLKNHGARDGQKWAVKSQDLYRLYVIWCDTHGYRPLGERVFGKEVRRVFPLASREKGGKTGQRFYYYMNIHFTYENICGHSTQYAVVHKGEVKGEGKSGVVDTETENHQEAIDFGDQ